MSKIVKSAYKMRFLPKMQLQSIFEISLLESYSNNPLSFQRPDSHFPIETQGDPVYKLHKLINFNLY